MAARASPGWLRRVLLAGLFAVALTTVLVPRSRPTQHSETLFVFGTLLEVVIHGHAPADARAAINTLDRALRRQHRAWHAWAPDSELAQLNAAIARGVPFEASAELAQVLKHGVALSQASGGLFDPAIGKLVALWGFHDDLPPTGPLPDPAAVDALRAAAPRATDLRFDGLTVSSLNPEVQLDLGAYAKGAALDLAAGRLSEMGIETAILNAGGDVTALGQPHNRPWRVAIRDPFGWGAAAAVALRSGESIYTSGNYERFLQQNGTRFSHILDPRTGWPVQEIVSATVIASHGALADAAATALSVAGQDWPATMRAMGLTAALVIDESGTLHATPAMAARLERVDPAVPLTPIVVPIPQAPAPMAWALRHTDQPIGLPYN